MFTIPWDEVFGMLDQHCWSCHPTGLMCNEMYDVSLSLSQVSVRGLVRTRKRRLPWLRAHAPFTTCIPTEIEIPVISRHSNMVVVTVVHFRVHVALSRSSYVNKLEHKVVPPSLLLSPASTLSVLPHSCCSSLWCPWVWAIVGSMLLDLLALIAKAPPKSN